jgi:isoaspartyl peptidase/L-asparaginase-like protein (Ntn-hydrolase superfamily)
MSPRKPEPLVRDGERLANLGCVACDGHGPVAGATCPDGRACTGQGVVPDGAIVNAEGTLVATVYERMVGSSA